MKVKLTDVAENIFAGGDVPKDRFSEMATEEYKIPIFANAEKDNGLYGYTDVARVSVPCVTVAARGTIGFTVKRTEPFLPVVRLITVIPNKEKITLDYLYYALRNCRPKSSGTSIPQLTIPDIKNYSFEIASISRQEETTRILDEVEQLIEIQKKQIDCYDRLIKARFVEMFGDPVRNPMNWERKRLDSICENLDYMRKPITASDRVGGKYPYYGASGIVDYVEDYIFDENILLISEDGANLLARVTPIAFSVSGKVWVNNHAHVVRFMEMCTQKYIEIYFSLIDISDLITGSAQPKLNQSKLNAMLIPIPPIEIQKKYMDFIFQVNNLKLIKQKELNETQLLFDSLMQKYFS